MSLQLTEFENLQIDPFPADKNVRVTITGLALCKFSAAPPIFRFLRHVPHHELLMKIIQVRNDMTNPKTITVKIEPTQNVEVSGTHMTAVNDPVHQPVTQAQNLSHLVKMRSDLHGNKPLEDRALPTPPPSFLKINNCAFYTHKLTDDSFYFEDESRGRKPSQKYCQVLGGYMSYSGDLIISPENSVPLTFPLNGFFYEIQFCNSCDTTPECREEEDFGYFYDIVQERGNPGRKFKMIKVSKDITITSTGTGACLPGCEDC